MSRREDDESFVDVKTLAPGDCGKTVNVVHGTFRCRRGYDLYTTTYLPAVRRTDACLVFHHGLADHSERHGRDDLLDFTRLFVTKAEEADVQTDAWAPAAAGKAEAPGQAPAGPANGLGSSFQEPGQQRRRKPRIFLLGYSMGGLVSTLAVAETCPVTPPAASALSPLSISTTRPCNPGSSPAPAAASEDDCAPADSPAMSAGAASAPGRVGTCGSSSNLFEGLMLTSCLTDPLYGNQPLLRAIKVAYVTVLSWVAPAVPLFKRNPVESGIRDPAAARAMADDTLWYRGRFKV
ncbi:hypothetical protein Vretifemale_6192 [Volvox reticuliferus]|uniref:Uncharacterized protein n=1 Tax=Volvox reticuliferus TaxID=1737510 RepID=A0A8J4C7X7_9CHLO|nr:hypothetical protein Vretifemale_6192 [Volvox reticuliferus]